MQHNIHTFFCRVMLFLTLIFCAQRTSSFTVYNESNLNFPLRVRKEKEVQVYDNCFTSGTCNELHHLAVEHGIRGDDGSSTFLRPPHNERPLTPLEHAIDSALTELGDTARLVEYWSRDEFMNIDVHADIDEVQLEEEGVIRCPERGHILYLEVMDGLKGPTCIFPGKKTGWDQKEIEDKIKLITVPAVKGRIVSFPGSSMHGVPKPADRWLMKREDERKLCRQDEKEEEHFDYDEDYDNIFDDDFDPNDEDGDIERSVLLFNTWHDDQPGPTGVNGDYATGAIPDGIELSEEDVALFSKSQEARMLKEWEDEYGIDSKELRCMPRSEWLEQELKTPDTMTESGDVRIRLMGSEERRICGSKYAPLKGPIDMIRDAFSQENAVSSINLQSK